MTTPASLLLTEDQRKKAGQAGLLQMGLSMLMAGAPPGGGRNAPTFLAALAAGTMAGRDAYSRYAETIRGAETARDIDTILEPGLTPDSLQSAFARAVRGGDIETARTLGSVLQTMISAQSQGADAQRLVKGDDPETGEVVFYDPITGDEVMRHPADADTLPPGLRGTQQQIIQRYVSRTSNVRDVANSYRRVLSATNTLLAMEQEAAAAKAAGREYHRPTAAAMAAISSFARLLDPGSVVREGEFHIVSNQGSLIDRLRRWYDSIVSGTIPEGLARALQDEAFRQTSAQRDTMNEIMEEEWRFAEAAGVERQFLPFTDPFESALQEYRAGSGDTFDYEQWLRSQGTPAPQQQNPLQLSPELFEEMRRAATGGRVP